MFNGGCAGLLKIMMAEHAGFCYGVRRAVQAAEEAAQNGPVVSLGPLIHNQQETARLERLGVKGICSEKQADPVLIRTHGVGPEFYVELKKQGRKIIDTTCPYVRKAQLAAQEAQEQGYQVIILGDKNHAEVQGIVAWAENRAIVVASLQELKKLELRDRVALLAQTTEKEERFAELVPYLQERSTDLKVFPTICSATRIRQKAAAKLAQEVNLMIVVGGKHSSNTKKLAEVCRKYISTYQIEDAQELKPDWFQDKLKVGVTAGASTPDWIIKEVVEQMEKINEKNAEENLEVIKEPLSPQNVQTGDLIKGTIVQVSSEEVLIDIGGKAEGILPVTEFANEGADLKEHLQVGEEILVEVIKAEQEGEIILSRKKVYLHEVMDKLEQAQESGEIIEAPVVEIVKGGLLVDVGIKGFVPASQVERFFVKDFQEYLQKTLRLKVLEIDQEKEKVVLSQRVVLEEEYEKQRTALLTELAEGQTRKGIVKRLTNFGAFVDLGGIDGLLHVSELGWGRVNHPADVVQVGDEVEVYILKVDQEKGKVSLSLKELLADPWQEAIKKYKVNSIISGKVVRIVPFGAFVELEPGLDGLIHISRISEQRIDKVTDVLKEGQEIKVKIMEIDLEKKRISLSLKDVAEDQEKAEYTSYLNQQFSRDTVTIGELLKEGQGDIIKDKIE
ncbi:MAG: bifunctional 4-hydroxy-3-methylbut-2-enyl diphosphate reductase/30S ribosomal protein S1 [Clostridia bacterium]|nr:bifunctional 4-hydroxy-3-methylbut-2-enyl diphosphate reductase/30S ribosomal protein S1 [Clostridia bacterium]MDD4666221.1 bifunctional 4-hydroxy-3-methylbut-2-enyl diphosphate reductase/30S ribosomal protein S1 [Clostridia bacterium]